MTVEDEIRRTLATYIIRLDDKDVEGIVELFARNGRIVVAPDLEASGHEEITQVITDIYATAPKGWRTKHLMASPLIDLQEGVANVTSDIVMLQALDETPWAVNRIGRHVDKLVREEGRWVFAEKRIELNKFVLGVV